MSDTHRRAGGTSRDRVKDRVQCDCECDCPATAWLNQPGKCQLCASGAHANQPTPTPTRREAGK